MDFARANVKVDAAKGLDAREILADVLDFQDCVLDQVIITFILLRLRRGALALFCRQAAFRNCQSVTPVLKMPISL